MVLESSQEEKNEKNCIGYIKVFIVETFLDIDILVVR